MAQTKLLALVLVCLMSWLDVATSLAHTLLPVRLAKVFVYFLSPFGYLLLQLYRRTSSLSSSTSPLALSSTSSDQAASPDYRVDSGFNTPISSGSVLSGKPLPHSHSPPTPDLSPGVPTAGSKDRGLPSIPNDYPLWEHPDLEHAIKEKSTKEKRLRERVLVVEECEEGKGREEEEEEEEEDFLIFAGVRCTTQDIISGPGARDMVQEMRSRIDTAAQDPSKALDSSLLMIVLARFFAIHPLPGLEDYLHSLIYRVGSLQEPQGLLGPSRLIYTLHTLALATYARARLELGLSISSIYRNHWPANSPLKQRLEHLSHMDFKQKQEEEEEDTLTSLFLHARSLTLRAGAEVAEEVGDTGAATWYIRQDQSSLPSIPSPSSSTALDSLLALGFLGPRSYPPLAPPITQARKDRVCRAENQVDQHGLSSLSTPHLVMYSMTHLTE
ncbi:MAG: hypothetical protein DHS80DRAFT_22139 [Piptocephalis tieghemiana]|nr:MAG: hypothetical protein DHS80DRAFT_22139 [Piptocephalis tieghemiana]